MEAFETGKASVTLAGAEKYGMLIGDARVSTDDPNPDLQLNVLKAAG